jgi:hypothetical protein
MDTQSPQNVLGAVTERILLKSFQEIQILFVYYIPSNSVPVYTSSKAGSNWSRKTCWYKCLLCDTGITVCNVTSQALDHSCANTYLVFFISVLGKNTINNYQRILHNISEKRRSQNCRLTIQSLVFNIYIFMPILSVHSHKTGLDIIIHSSHFQNFPSKILIAFPISVILAKHCPFKSTYFQSNAMGDA